MLAAVVRTRGHTRLMREVNRDEVRQLIDDGAQVLEVLGREEFDEDHLPGAMNIPLRRLDDEATATLDRGRPVVVYCWDSA